MSKNTTFESTTPLTVDHFNSFVQDSQIVQETGNSKTDVMSQEAVTNALKYLEYGAASKANCVFHATGKVQNNIIKACTDKPFDTVIPGTTVIVKMEDNYTYSGSYARLDAGGKLCDIVLRYGENANAAVKTLLKLSTSAYRTICLTTAV